MKQSTDPQRVRPTEAAARSVGVPELGGVPVSDAIEQLRALELVPGIEPATVDAESDVGVVVGQDPAAGSDARVGAVVVLTVGQRRNETLTEDEAPIAHDVTDDEWFADVADSTVVTDDVLESTERPPDDEIEPDIALERANDVGHARRGERRRPIVRVLDSRPSRLAVWGLAVLLAFVVGRTLGSSGGSPAPTARPAATTATSSPAPPLPRPPGPVSPRPHRREAGTRPRRQSLNLPRPPQRQATSTSDPSRATARTPSSLARPHSSPPAAPSQLADSRPHCEFCFENP